MNNVSSPTKNPRALKTLTKIIAWILVIAAIVFGGAFIATEFFGARDAFLLRLSPSMLPSMFCISTAMAILFAIENKELKAKRLEASNHLDHGSEKNETI